MDAITPLPAEPSRSRIKRARLSRTKRFKRACQSAYQSAIIWLQTSTYVVRAVFAIAQFGLIVAPGIMAGKLPWQYGAAYVGVWLVVAFYKAFQELSPTNMQMVRRDYLKRKLILYRLVQEMQRDDLTLLRIAEFQRDALDLIANYVRSHRADSKGTTIFVNLLRDTGGDSMPVIARNQEHRGRSDVIPKDISLAWAAFESGEPQVSGDIYEDAPDTPAGKPYRSVLAIPVRLHGAIVGVVSIDSTRPYHFDSNFRVLVEYLMPYVGLLGWTLVRQSAMLPAPRSDSQSTEE